MAPPSRRPKLASASSASDLRSSSLIVAMESGAAFTISAAISRALAMTSARGTTAFARPQRPASSAPHAPAGHQHLQGDGARQPARQADRAAVGKEADEGLRQAQLRGLGDDHQVAGQRQLEAAAEGEAVDRGDHRLVEVEEARQAGEAAGAEVVVGAFALGRGLQVPAGREEALAGAGDDGDPERGVVAELAKGLAHEAAGGGIDGVRLGPVEGDLQDRPVALDLENLAHARPLILVARRF